MSCIHLLVETEEIEGLGGSKEVRTMYKCALGTSERIVIGVQPVKIGIGGICPIPTRGKGDWGLCKFREAEEPSE
jgi:hypothetical protein